MKGPGGRQKFDVRRVWECPVCQRREKTAGTVVNLLCNCLAGNNPPAQTWMRLIEETTRGGPEARPSPAPDVD